MYTIKYLYVQFKGIHLFLSVRLTNIYLDNEEPRYLGILSFDFLVVK